MQSETRASLIIGAICLVVGIVLGAFAGTWVERRRGDERMSVAVAEESARASQLQKSAAMAQLHLRLGRLAMLADRQDYGRASEEAATFFDDAAQMARETNREEMRAALQQVLAARDEVTAGLATAQPAAAQRLRQLFLALFDNAV